MLAYDFTSKSIPAIERRANLIQMIWFAFLIGFSAFIGIYTYVSGAVPGLIAWAIYLVGVLAIFYRPRYGIYLLLFFTLVGDTALLEWYPFFKNFSSIESIFYLNDSLIISPLELYIVLTYLSWIGRSIKDRHLKVHRTWLFWPSLIFAGFMVFGLLWGIRRGGSFTIGLWESRPIFYLTAMLILASNLLEKREHVIHLMWIIMLAIFIEGINGSNFFLFVLRGDLGRLEAITEHSAAIHMNTLFVFVGASWLYKMPRTRRLALLMLIPPVFLTYLATQRRASYVALILALIIMAFILFRENRQAFWLLVPPMALLAVAYIGVFWNASGALAMPAQAVKSVVAQDQANLKDQRSNMYRAIENVNSEFTIRQLPLTGVGFGSKFFILVPMPDISFFEWWEYITHNSIIWIWMKTGVGGFFSMLFLIGLAIMVGARALWRMPGGELSAIALTGTLYIIMHFVYAYVDMSWDIQSMVYVGAVMGMLSALERIVAAPVPVPPKRWRWQPEPQSVPQLIPLPEMTLKTRRRYSG